MCITVAMKTQQAIHIYCTDKLRAKLQILAAANNRTMSAQVQHMIKQAFELHLVEQTRIKNELKG